VVLALPAANGDTAPDWAWSLTVADSLTYGPVPGGQSDLLLPVAPEQLLLVDRDGVLLGDPLALVKPDAEPAGRLTGQPINLPTAAGSGWAVPTEEGWFRVTAGRSGFEANPTFHPYTTAVPDSQEVQALRVPQADADLVLICAGAHVDAYTVGADMAGPVPWLGAPGEELVAEPATADLDGNGRNDVIMVTPERIHASQASGEAITGFPVRLGDLFPLADSTRVAGPVVVADTDGDRANEVYFTTDGGHLIGLESDGQLIPRTPFRWGDRAAAGLAVGDWDATSAGRVVWLLSGGGYTGPPLDRQYRNGRTISYALPGTRPDAGGTSEWRSAGGGFARSGPVGEVTDLGSASPLAAVAERPLVYPNPLRDDRLTVRFFSAGGAPAEFVLYNLEGEQVAEQSVETVAGQINEHVITLPGLASGLYVCRLIHDASGSRETTTFTLAVEH
jgi:hypothetical protein